MSLESSPTADVSPEQIEVDELQKLLDECEHRPEVRAEVERLCQALGAGGFGETRELAAALLFVGVQLAADLKAKGG